MAGGDLATAMSSAMPSAIVAAVLWGAGLWIGGAVMTSWVAVQKRRSGAGWFVNALLLSAVVALLALASIPDGDE